MKRYLYGVIVGMIGLVWACSYEAATPESGVLNIRMDNVVGGADLTLNDVVYTNAAGEAFTVSRFNYFISNIRLRRAEGADYVVPQDSSYFLVLESDPASQTLRLRNVPTGDYTGLSFVIGVDSARSVAGVDRRKGILDPANPNTAGMAWDWNTGYIFLKLEGTSPAAPTDATGLRNYVYHVGLFGRNGTPNNLRTISLSFANDRIRPATTGTSTVTIKADVQKIFNGATQVSIAQNSNVMISPYSSTLANNYAQMFSVGGLTQTER